MFQLKRRLPEPKPENEHQNRHVACERAKSSWKREWLFSTARRSFRFWMLCGLTSAIIHAASHPSPIDAHDRLL